LHDLLKILCGKERKGEGGRGMEMLLKMPVICLEKNPIQESFRIVRISASADSLREKKKERQSLLLLPFKEKRN